MSACHYIVITLASTVSLCACKRTVEWYCDEDTPCLDRYPDRPYCDLYGQYPDSEGVGRTCIPFPEDPDKTFCLQSADCPADRPICQPNLECGGCSSNQQCIDLGDEVGATFCSTDGHCLACEPDAFLRCDSDAEGEFLVTCASDGAGEVTSVCGVSCDPEGQRCRDCAPNSESCVGGPGPGDWEFVTCDASGNEASRTACYVGCDDGSDTPGCLDIDPLNGLALLLDMTQAAPSVTIPSGAQVTIDTDALTWTGGGVNTPPSYAFPGIAVFMVGGLHVEGDTVTTRVNVVGSRALAIVAHGDIVIGGVLSAGAVGSQPGPGTSWSPGLCAGSSGDNGSAPKATGGGGGSFGTVGGPGGDLTEAPVIPGGPAGQAIGGTFDLEPLVSGCAGASSADDSVGGGGGGGAIQLVSRTAIHISGGWLGADGGGGGIDQDGVVVGSLASAPGGGSGGGILLEAPIVTLVSGSLTANGGNGGCLEFASSGSYTVRGGADGTLSPANPVSCSQEAAGTVWAGRGDSEQLPLLHATDEPGGTSTKTGGGGGGMGVIQVDAFTTSFVDQPSPDPMLGVLRTRLQQ